MVKDIVTFLGAVFLAIGIWGIFQNPIMGVFAVDSLHNFIHLGTGILAIIFGLSSEASARAFSKVIGFVYAAVGVLGLFSDGNTVMGLFVANMADHMLHFIFAIVFLVLGYAPHRITHTAGYAR